jgi:hypothetical protein
MKERCEPWRLSLVSASARSGGWEVEPWPSAFVASRDDRILVVNSTSRVVVTMIPRYKLLP